MEKNLIKIHADDYGLSKSINDSILESIDNGNVNSVSVIVNNIDRKSVNELKKRNVDIYLHICLTEGISSSKNEKNIGFIYDKNFKFNKRIFFYLYQIDWLKKDKKNKISEVINEEINQQIQIFKKYFSGSPLKIDGHQHIHINKEIYKLLIKKDLYEIRVPRDSYKLKFKNLFNIKILINLIKVIIIKSKCKELESYIKNKDIKYIKTFFGILYSGITTKEIIRENINFYKKNKNDGVMILLHPGYSSKNEQIPYLNDRQSRFYKSNNRLLELNACKDNNLKLII